MKRKFVKIHYLKVCSVITAVCFLVSTIGSNLYASATSLIVSSCDDIFNSMSIIKQEYGKVTAVQDNSSDITVVNIQDLHCHEQTQRNISEIIKTLDKNYSLKSVFIEGGYGQIDVSWINKIQDEKTKSAVIEKMLQDGYLTGAEYYAIKNSRYDLLKGIEEKNIHQTNLNRLSKIIEKQPEYNSVISKINKEIEVLSGIYLNERNKRFTGTINEYASGKTDTLKFYRLLHKYVEKIRQSPGQYNNITAINMQDYPNISKYLNISSMSKDINPRQVGIELQALVNVVKNKIPYGSYKRLLSVTNNFNDTGKLAEFLIKFCEQNKIDLSKDFKELDKFFEVSRLNQRINPLELVNEEKILIDQIRMALSYDNTEYEISYINDFAKYFNDYFKYALTSADWKYVRQNFDKFRTLYAKYAAVDRIKDISSDIDFINQYYDTNDYRNNIFTANILNGEKPLQTSASLRTSEQLLKQSKEVIVVITGGYHSQDLESIFSEKKVNDIVITPNVTGDIKNANMRYDGIIKEQASMQSSALAFRLASCLPDEEQKNLMARVAVEIYGKENIDRIRQLAGNDFDISKIETAEFDEQKKSAVKDLMQAAVSALGSSLPLNAGKDIFNPDIDDILTKMSLKFYDMGFYFENGPVYEIDSSEYKDKDLLGIPAETYSRMFDGLQRALLNVQKNRDFKNKLSIFDVLKNKNSIFAFLAKTAPVWEEIIFRAIPSFVIIFNPVAGIALFGVSQIIFLFSHTIVKWLVYRDSAGNRLDFIGILKRDFKNLSIPALTVALPYILTAGAPIFILPVITVASMAIHYFYNKNNPGNPMLILALLKNAAPENVKERMIMYAKMIQAGKETINKIKFLDNDLLYSVISQSSDPQQTAVNLINKIKYVDQAIINAMEEPEYVFDVFEASDALLEYVKKIGFDAYNFNLFFKLRNSAGIKNEEFPNIWLANIVRDDLRMHYLDNAVLTGIERILRIFGPGMNIDTIRYLFNKLLYPDGFDFDKFFRLTAENNLTKSSDKLRLLQISFDNGFEDDAGEILGFSDIEDSAITEMLVYNENKTKLQNFRLFSELKEMLGIKPEDKDNIRFLAKYCFDKGNIIETDKLTDKLNEDIFIQNLKTILKYENKEYILTPLLADLTTANIYLSDSRCDQIMKLLEEMSILNIADLAVNNNNLALRVFLSPAFTDVFNSQISKEKFKNIDNTIQKYRRAIAVSIFMTKLLNGRESLVTPENFDKIVKISANAYFAILRQWFDKQLADKDSFVTAIFHDESADIVFKDMLGDRFNPEILKQFLNKIGIDPDNGDNVQILQRSKDPGVKFKILDRIINAPKNGVKSLFWFDGHGAKYGFSITEKEHIYFEEIADALHVAYDNGVDLKQLTLVFNSCHSGDFKDKILTMLEQRGVKDSPVIITVAGHETELGYTDIVEHDGNKMLVSNLEFSIFNLFESSSNADSVSKNLLLGDFILAQNDIHYSNPTISIPITEDVRTVIERAVAQINNINQETAAGEREDEASLLIRTGTRMSLDAAQQSQKLSEIHSSSLELSIFNVLKNKSKLFAFLAKTAPVWEEIMFRVIPSAVTIFNPAAGIALFAVSQIVFLFSHTIVKWLVYRDSAGRRLDFAGILKDDFRNLSLPTLAVSIPYILAIIINPVFWPMAAVSAMIVHSLFNDKLSILGYFKNIKLKDNFDIKLPLQALGIKAGDEILITYFSNDTLLITRNSLELKKFWEEYKAKNPQKAKFRNRIYANTMRVTVANNGTVNIKELYKNKLEKYPLTQEQKNNITLFYSQVPVKSEEKTEIISDKSEEPVKDNGEEEIQNALTDKINPDNAIDFDFSRFIDGQTGSADIVAVREYVKSVIVGKDLKNSLITVTFSNLADAGLDENKIKTAARIISLLSDEFNEIFADRIAGSAGMTYFEDMLENAFVHGNNLSLSKKIFIYFGNDRDALIINSNTPQNTTIEASALATKLYLYGFGTGIKSAESVNNARYSVTGLLMPDGTEKELYIAYLSFKKYQQLKETLLDKVLKKINFSAIWNTIETKKIERRYSYTALPVLEEGESVVATNFTKDGEAEYSGDWINFTVSKKGGKYIISNVSKKENKLKWYIPPQWQIPLEDKLEIAEENGKFYICSNYADIHISVPQSEESAETDIFYPLSQRNEEQIQSELPAEQSIPADNIEFERFFELVQKNSAKKPVIGDSENYEYKLKLQKLSFKLADTLDLNQMEEFYKNDEDKLRLVKYLQILKFKRLKDNESLRAIVYNGGLNIKYRLLAFMYLRSNGVNDFNDTVLEIMKANFLIELNLNTFKIDTNFDLSLLGAGILLVLSRYLTDNHYINEQQEKNLYDNISYSTFVERRDLDNSSANSGMFFTSSDPLTMAHEIGHRVLLFYADSSKGVAYSTIHEIFAGVISAVFAEQSEMGGQYYQDALYELFNERMKYDYVLQEEHRVSIGLLYTVSEIAKRMGKTVKFEFLADAILNLLKSKKGLPQRQPDAIKDVIYEYMKVLMFKDGYTQGEIEQFEKILKEESWKSKVLELFINLKNTSSRWDYYEERYPSLMSRMRFEVVQPESYRYGLLEIDYRNDLVVINNIIMSQPDKINIVMQIVKEELSKSDYLFRPQIARLLFADLLVSLPQIKQLSKYQLDRLIQNLVDKFFSDKTEYSASEIDYERIRIYALEEYILIKTSFPRSFEERNSAKKDSFKNNYYRQEINHDDAYRYAESLPSFVPTMDVFFLNTVIVKIYRKFFDFTVKKLAAAKKRPRFNRDVENYLNIVRNKTQNKYLVKIINNDRASVKYRLFALMYLRNSGYDIEDNNVINDIKRKFAEAINKNGITVNNNFDLRAVLTGVYLLLENFSRQYVNSKQEIELYELISKAVVLRKGKESVGAKSNMTFVSVNPLTMAHELGHRILASASERSLKNITIHELFAETTANLFAGIAGLKEKTYSEVLYRLFDDSVNYDDVFQDEHRASMGFIEFLREVSAQTGRTVRWDILANAIVSYTKRPSSEITDNQSKNLKNVFLEYLDSLYKNRQYTYYELRNMFNASQRINVGENVVSEILEDIKNKDPRLYGHILNALQKTMKRQKSYMKGFIPRILYSKSKVKEIADIFKENFGIKPEYADDKDIITKLIFSQPKRINYVLKIIINQILSKKELSRYDFENLIKLEFLLNNTAVMYNSRAELEFGISGILNDIIGTVGNDPFHRHYNTFNLSDYRYVQSYMKNRISGANSRLTMTWLDNLLLSFGKTDFNERQKIVAAVEYPIIILGMFFPKIRNWFLNKHKVGDISQIEIRLTQLETTTLEKIKNILKIEISDISSLSFIRKLAILSKILANKTIKTSNMEEHLKLNDVFFNDRKVLSSKKNQRINLKFQAYNEHGIFPEGNKNDGINELSVLIASDIKKFEGNEFINTGIKVNEKTIWQIDIDGMLVFGVEGVNIQEAAQALSGSKILEKKIKKLLHLKKKVRLNINSIIVDEQAAEMFFYGRTAVINTDQYAKTVNKILDSISVMYAQKTIISLVNISDNDLYSALSNGALRKVITAAQFEYLKKEFEMSGKDILREIIELRKRGIEIYISGTAVDEQYKNFAISGQVIDSAVYDYYSRETFEIELIKEKISLQQLENKIINSDKPLVIEMNLLKEIFRTTKDITAAYNGLQSLIGSIKIKFGLKDIKIKDMESFAYSIDFSDLPAVREDEILFNSDIGNFSDVFGLDKDNIIRIILEDAKIKEDVKKVFFNIIKERILAKTKLSESNKPNGLKDKKMEILLGKLLFLQYGNTDKTTLLPEIDSFKGSESDMQRKINELYGQFAADNDSRIINTMIELIVIYCEEYGDKEIKEMNDINRTDSYRKMLAAA